MACFAVPAAEAVIAAAVKKGFFKKESRNPFIKRFNLLSNMLWGGSALLAFEHIWHGEITASFPFLTAMKNPEDTAAMLNEMATSGVMMALLVTTVWVCMVVMSNVIEKRVSKAEGEG